MKMNQTSCVAMYNHVKLTVIHASKESLHFFRGVVGENPDYEAPEGGGRERGGDPVDAQHLCSRIKIDRSRETSVSPPPRRVVETILERLSSRASLVFPPYE